LIRINFQRKTRFHIPSTVQTTGFDSPMLAISVQRSTKRNVSTPAKLLRMLLPVAKMSQHYVIDVAVANSLAAIPAVGVWLLPTGAFNFSFSLGNKQMIMLHKKLLLAAGAWVALVAFSAMPALAADLPARTYSKAPVMVDPGNWTGFYVGGNVGYGWGTTTWSDIVAPIGNVPGDFTQHHTNGMVGGFQWGYNRQVGQWVFGFASDFDWTAMKGSSGCIGNDLGFAASCGTKVPWISTSTARVGWAAGQFLPYVKGGVALTRDEFNVGNFIYFDPTHAGQFNYLPTKSYRVGWTVGAGLEFAIDRNWSAFAEYDYMDFGKNQEGFTPSVPTVFTTNFSANIRQTMSVAKVGVNFKYGDFLFH
jgi:outer membrane immunogenic protein